MCYIMHENIQDTDILAYGFRYCACDCGRIIKAVDAKGREVRYICGHNRRKDKSNIKKEIGKINDIQEARDIIYNQYKIIHELQRILERHGWKEDGWKEDNNNTTGFEDGPTW